MKRTIGVAAVLVTSTLACARPALVSTAPPMQCEQLSTLKLENTIIATAERVTTRSFRLPGSPDSVANLPPFCRVVGEIRPTTDSRIAFEVWLPLENWNGKFAGVGNGGWAGVISYQDLGNQLRRGYATVSTNTGHAAEPGIDMAKFAYQHPERLADFGWRSVHEMTVKGKAVTQTFYGRPARYAYFIGCSTGGNQGLSEAQRFPADYDGIVARDPANNFARLMAGDFAANVAATKDSASYLPPPLRRVLQAAALRACDALDGVTDSLITNPNRCAFDPAVVQCTSSAQQSGTCLTPAQVETARRIYAGLKDSGGRQVYPGLMPGSETFWGPFTNPATPFFIPISYYRWLVFGDRSWDWKSFDLTRPGDYALHLEAERKYAPVLSAIDPNLRAFKARGGKLIQTHGWNDQLISPQNSIDYYESVLAYESGGRDPDATLRSVQEFYRLFMAPGVLHCGGGPGPNVFDAQTALEAWVERGTAPDSIIANHLTSGVPDRSRPLCPYPKVARYKGTGDVNRPESFACGVPSGD